MLDIIFVNSDSFALGDMISNGVSYGKYWKLAWEKNKHVALVY
jgi:hypothetical protein